MCDFAFRCPTLRFWCWFAFFFNLLAKTAGLTLGLEEGKNVTFLDGALDVADNRTGVVVEELNTDLGHTTTGASAAKNLGDLGVLDFGFDSRGILHIIHHTVSLTTSNNNNSNTP